MRGLYTLGIRAYAGAVKAAALFGNLKAKRWVKGRKQLPEAQHDDEAWVWFHAASLGESLRRSRNAIPSGRFP